ncbi:hypothetical protein PPYR_15538, partial [Photinus pyralis]
TQLKAKWKNIKDSFKKSVKTKSGAAAPKKSYVHFEALSFLLNSAEKRGTSGNYEGGHENSADEEGRSRSPIRSTSSSAVEDAEASQHTPRSTLYQTQKKSSLPPKMTAFQNSLLQTLGTASTLLHKSQVPEPEDPDRQYLLSLLPDYKNLPLDKKWEFRQHVVNFFKHTYSSAPTPPLQPFTHNPLSAFYTSPTGTPTSHYHNFPSTSSSHPPSHPSHDPVSPEWN